MHVVEGKCSPAHHTSREVTTLVVSTGAAPVVVEVLEVVVRSGGGGDSHTIFKPLITLSCYVYI